MVPHEGVGAAASEGSEPLPLALTYPNLGIRACFAGGYHRSYDGCSHIGEVLMLARNGWEDVLPTVLDALSRDRLAESELVDLLVEAGRASGVDLGLSCDAMDPLSFASCVARTRGGDLDASLGCLCGKLGLFVRSRLDGSGMIALDGDPCLFDRGVPDESLVDGLWSLADAAASAADAHAFGMVPNVMRREFANALQAVLDLGRPQASLSRLSGALYLLRPRTYLPLTGCADAYLRSPDGLGVDPDDLPETAADYLDLLQFMLGEMSESRLPFSNPLQLVHAAETGVPLARGLAPVDREELVERRLRPILERLYPRDQSRVDEECDRAIRG